MKNLKFVLTATALAVTGLVGCNGEKTPACKNHVDADHDGKCDVCSTDVAVNHVDANHDAICDVCSAEVTAHVHNQFKDDLDHDYFCDACGYEFDSEITDIVLDVTNAKTSFSKGEPFDSTGVKVIATRQSGSKEELAITKITGGDTSKVSNKVAVKVYYMYLGVEVYQTYNISVSYWSNEELANMKKIDSILAKQVDLPYLLGMRLETLADGSWRLIKENSNKDELKTYGKMLSSVDGSYKNGEDTVVIKPVSDELFDNSAELVGVRRDAALCYSVKPHTEYTETYEDTGETETYSELTGDTAEYLVVGLDENNNLIVKNRIVNNYLTYALGHLYGFPAEYIDGVALLSGAYEYINMFLNSNNGGLCDLSLSAAGNIPVVNLDVTENSSDLIMVTDIIAHNPFTLDYDQYKAGLLLEFAGKNLTVNDRNKFIADLLALDYVQAEGRTVTYEDEDGKEQSMVYDVFKLEDKYTGNFKIEITPFDEMGSNDGVTLSGFAIRIFYTQPAVSIEQTSAQERFLAKKVLPALGVNNGITYNRSAAFGGCCIATFKMPAGIASSNSEAADIVLSQLSGYATLGDPVVNSDNSVTVSVTIDKFLLKLNVSLSGSNISVKATVTTYIATPEEVTLESLATLLNTKLTLNTMFAAQDGSYVATNVRTTYNKRYAKSFADQIIQPYLPEYFTFQCISYGDEGNDVIYRTFDKKFALHAYFVDTNKEDSEAEDGFTIYYTLTNYVDPVTPANLTASKIAGLIFSSLGISGGSPESLGGGFGIDEVTFDNEATAADVTAKALYDSIIYISAFAPEYFEVDVTSYTFDARALTASINSVSTDGKFVITWNFAVEKGSGSYYTILFGFVAKEA